MGLSACATVGLIKTNAGYEDAFRGASQAVAAAGFTVKASDINTGVISGEVPPGGRWLINVTVRKVPTGAEIEASVQSIGTGFAKLYFDKFVKALNRQIPDASVVAVQ